MSGGWEVIMKERVFPTLHLFLISSPGVSMATKSLSGGSFVCWFTDVHQIPLSVSPPPPPPPLPPLPPQPVKLPSPTPDKQTQHGLNAISLNTNLYKRLTTIYCPEGASAGNNTRGRLQALKADVVPDLLLPLFLHLHPRRSLVAGLCL